MLMSYKMIVITIKTNLKVDQIKVINNYSKCNKL